MTDPSAFVLQQEAVGRKICVVFFSKLRAGSVEMRREKRCNANVADLDWLLILQRQEPESKGQRFFEQKDCIQHLAQRFYGFGGQIDCERTPPAFEPHALHEHEEAADVIRMEVGEENRVDLIVTHAA